VRPTAAALVLAGVAVTALLTTRLPALGAIAAVLLALAVRAGRRAVPYLWGTLTSALLVFALWPLLQTTGYHVLWSGPTVPVLGPLDLTSEELRGAARVALQLAAVGLAFAVYALLLDHDRLLAAAAGRRSVLGAALATRLLPTLERDARGLVEALRGRGITPVGLRGHAALLSPLLAGSLERGLNLAEAMEARGFGRPGRTRAPAPAWRALDVAAVAGAAAFVLAGILWL
jgi:energy-coupling factor transport system permease protein